jgi:hypothetical protein
MDMKPYDHMDDRELVESVIKANAGALLTVLALRLLASVSAIDALKAERASGIREMRG